jgi:hypothetical protein
MLERKAYAKLLEWKQTRAGKTALLIEGARRVGKSTLIKQFGQNEYKSMLFIDLFQAPKQVKDYFDDFRDDFDSLFLYLSTHYKVELFERETLVVFDEVQAYPLARGLIKYLVEDGRYDYIETGSLISIKQNIADIVIPSEEVSMQLNPMDFEEFLWAMDERQLADLIRLQYGRMQPLPDALHRRALRLFREYMLVGGMPAPLQTYVNERKFANVDAEKRQILTLYRNDIARFASGYEFKVTSMFDEIPAQLSKHEKKFTLSALGKSARRRDYEEAIFWLSDAKIANMCFASTDPNIGLLLNSESSAFKCYMADTGLLVSLAFADRSETEEGVYSGILRGDLGINEGMLIENIVAQMLVALGYRLYFYSDSGKADPSSRMEIDFLIPRPDKNAAGKMRISPVEVKSARQYGTKSLDRFAAKFASRVGEQVILHPKQLKIEGQRWYIPLYMGFCL